MINESLKCIEPVIYGFAREADALVELVEDEKMINMINRRAMLQRAYMAKDIAAGVTQEIEDKRNFLKKYKDLGKKGTMRFQGVTKTRFLKSKI